MGRIGLGSAHAAVSVLNAIPTGIGAAVGVNLRLQARVKLLEEGLFKGMSSVRGETISISERVLSSVAAVVKRRYGAAVGLEVKVDSEIPVGRGLKSSNALFNAVIMGCLDALGEKVKPEEAAFMASEAAKLAGLTITGGLDDSLATVGHGIYVTENYGMRLLKRIGVEPLKVVIHVPSRMNLITSVSKETFLKWSRYYRIAVGLLLESRWEAATLLNGLLTCLVIGEDPLPIVEVVSRGSVVAAGVSGKGPAMFAVTENPDNVLETWHTLRGELITTRIIGGGP